MDCSFKIFGVLIHIFTIYSLHVDLRTDGYDCGDAVAEFFSNVLEEPGTRVIMYDTGLFTERTCKTEEGWWNNEVPKRIDDVSKGFPIYAQPVYSTRRLLVNIFWLKFLFLPRFFLCNNVGNFGFFVYIRSANNSSGKSANRQNDK